MVSSARRNGSSVFIGSSLYYYNVNIIAFKAVQCTSLNVVVGRLKCVKSCDIFWQNGEYEESIFRCISHFMKTCGTRRITLDALWCT